MKKLFFIGLAATAMLASCSNDETVDMAQSKAISFSSFIDKSTRTTDTGLDNLGSIEVYGWSNDTQIFDAQTVTVDANGTGTYTPIQYWVAGYSYAFEAIAPKSGDKGVTFAAAKTGGTITFENNATTDLLYSGVVSKPTVGSSDPGAVHFTFKHMLSRVKFTFINGFDADSPAEITVKDVKIAKAYKNGTITPAATGAVWTATDASLNVAFASDAVANLEAQRTAATEHMYLIPVASPEYELTFTVTLNQNGVTKDYNHTVTIGTSMEISKSYNFVATITPENIDTDGGLKPIEFTAEVAAWGEFGDDITVKE